ncbi:MAG TPA: hypothetical protein VGS41_08355 [Chthonomonadales bacterium]|nr:hypothetical protein [Chthonomonadales bacterium]
MAEPSAPFVAPATVGQSETAIGVEGAATAGRNCPTKLVDSTLAPAPKLLVNRYCPIVFPTAPVAAIAPDAGLDSAEAMPGFVPGPIGVMQNTRRKDRRLSHSAEVEFRSENNVEKVDYQPVDRPRTCITLHQIKKAPVKESNIITLSPKEC